LLVGDAQFWHVALDLESEVNDAAVFSREGQLSFLRAPHGLRTQSLGVAQGSALTALLASEDAENANANRRVSHLRGSRFYLDPLHQVCNSLPGYLSCVELFLGPVSEWVFSPACCSLVLHNPHGPLAHRDTVMHLFVRETAKVGFSNTDNSFNICITASDTVESVKQLIEAQRGLAAGAHKLVYNGTVLSSTKPLANYGIRNGCVVELVPVGCGSSALPSGSPMLTSPAHSLWEDFQSARAGLANGYGPKLAPAGSGGSYFISDANGNNVAVFKPEDEVCVFCRRCLACCVRRWP
jgi:Ubiquitin family